LICSSMIDSLAQTAKTVVLRTVPLLASTTQLSVAKASRVLRIRTDDFDGSGSPRSFRTATTARSAGGESAPIVRATWAKMVQSPSASSKMPHSTSSVWMWRVPITAAQYALVTQACSVVESGLTNVTFVVVIVPSYLVTLPGRHQHCFFNKSRAS
jgi:hypothetical protein